MSIEGKKILNSKTPPVFLLSVISSGWFKLVRPVLIQPSRTILPVLLWWGRAGSILMDPAPGAAVTPTQGAGQSP